MEKADDQAKEGGTVAGPSTFGDILQADAGTATDEERVQMEEQAGKGLEMMKARRSWATN